ncbi:MAG: hypothetical protein HY906_02145 [Deltaproteobacteria bacterium]|nr:hypothetical protein [Deltaproteobacteria bacterium]
MQNVLAKDPLEQLGPPETARAPRVVRADEGGVGLVLGARLLVLLINRR